VLKNSLFFLHSTWRILCYSYYYVEVSFVTLPLRAKGSLLFFLPFCVKRLLDPLPTYFENRSLFRRKIPICPSGFRLFFHIHGSD
jgi:hypothetical protein